LGFLGILTLYGITNTGSVSAAPIIVAKSGIRDYSNIQDAIDNANLGDIIKVYAGTYFENIVINERISLIGNGSVNTTIDGCGIMDVVRITANDVRICGFTVTNSSYTISSGVQYAGIKTNIVKNVNISNNNCSKNEIGIALWNSESNTIENNNCSFNDDGIFSYSSNSNNFKNNTCVANQYIGIIIDESDSNTIIKNTCNSKNGSGIILKKSHMNKLLKNVCNNNIYHGISLNKSNSNSIDNNICNSNRQNIVVIKSNSNIITNNSCKNSRYREGIGLWESKSHVINNNSMFNCSILIDGLKIQHWNSHTLDLSNTVNHKPVYYWRNRTGDTVPSNAGKVILVNCTNVKVKNLKFTSSEAPIQIGFSFNNTIINNTFTNNSVCIYTLEADNNIIANNSCISNDRFGMLIVYSDANNIENNYISKTMGIGIVLSISEGNLISNNFCNMNKENSIHLQGSKHNTIINNNASSNNKYGIYLNYSADSNIITNNHINNNNETGVCINNSNNNKIYHNNFIQNPLQAKVVGYSYNNRWNNNNGEGNYWSDYTGLDNGANDRIAGDGVGDTKIPHLGLDNFPLVNGSGWMYPGIPILYKIDTDFDDFDSDGNYSVKWPLTRGVTGYILEEGTNSDFKSSSMVYNGSDFSHEIIRKDNGTYFYRIKGYNEDYVSAWSNVVNVTVDHPPKTPQNLTISIYPMGNTLNISWALNQIDSSEYDLYYRRMSNITWHRAAILKHPKCTFNHTSLLDGQEYEYKIVARDLRGQESVPSGIVIGIPNDSFPPVPPKGLRVEFTTINSIKLTWEPNTENDLEGYRLYRGYTSNLTVYQILIGKLSKDEIEFLDEDLEENTTYYYRVTAIDEIPNESNYSNMVSGTTTLDQHPPFIKNFMPDVNMMEDTIDNSSINLKYWFSDVNNDHLTYRCKRNYYIDVVINHQDGSVSLIPPKNWCGTENIIFCCSDDYNEIKDNITITVWPVNDPPDKPEIISLNTDLRISEGDKINFEGRCTDPDILYGDELTYQWSSDISGELDIGRYLNRLELPPGEHTITLTVKDKSGNSSFAEINVTVLKTESPPSNLLFTSTNILFVIIIIIILIILFIFLQKKRTNRYKKQVTKISPEGFSEMKSELKTSSTSMSNQLLPTSQIPSTTISKSAILKPTFEISSELEKLPPYSKYTSPKQTILDYSPKMIGREHEVNELKEYLERAMEGQGRTIFISGEAGIGKSRLITELMQVAQARGFQILLSNCEYESLTPYMPFIKALKVGGLDHLFAEEVPRIEAVYLVTHSGLSIKEILRQETKLRPDIFTSMLTAVGNFVKESLSIMSDQDKEGTLNTLGYENYRILIESGDFANLVVLLTGKENEFLINDIKDIHLNLEKKYENVLKSWDGDDEKVAGIDEILKPLITSGKYDGVYYGEHDPKVKRDFMFENINMGLIRQSEETPLLLCIEDLQWSDPSSLALMYHISRNSMRSRLVILGTYRPEEVTIKKDTGGPLTEIMQLMEHEGLSNRMELSRLTKERIADFLTSILGGSSSSSDLRNLIYRETEGNPLFIIQLTKYLVEENIIMHSKGTWQIAKNVEELNIPPKIYQVIAQRLERLERKNRELLEYASVIGETFSSTTLAAALKITRLELLGHLRDLEQKHRLIHSDNGNYKFDHAKIKEVVYSEIPFELRIEYHSIVANTIEKLNKNNLDKVIEELAFHYYQCKNKKKAQFYLLDAARKAKKNYSNSEAIRFYSSALEFEEDEIKRKGILDSIGRIYDLMGDYDKGLEAFKGVLELTKEPKEIADIKAKIGIIHLKKGDYDITLSLGTEALDLVEGQASSEEALALETLAYAYHRKGEYDKTFKHHKRSLEIREKLDDKKGIGTCYKNLGIVLLARGDYDNALKFFEKGIFIFEQQGDNQGIQDCLNNIGDLYFNSGEYEKAFEYYRKSYQIIETTGDQGDKALLLLNIGHSLLLIGETEKAQRSLEKSLLISKNNDLHAVTACNYWVMAELYIELGNLKIALNYCLNALNLATKVGNKEIIASLRRVFGIIYKKQGKWELAIENFNESIRIILEIGNEKELGDSYFEFGLMWKEKGDIESAKVHLNNAYDMFVKLNLEKKKKIVRLILNTL
jgi:parallel beta-helix repeat protein